MSNDPIPTHEQILALAALVRGGTLTSTQREQTAVVLGLIGSALRIAAQAGGQHPDDPAATDASVAGGLAAGRHRVRPAGAPADRWVTLTGRGTLL